MLTREAGFPETSFLGVHGLHPHRLEDRMVSVFPFCWPRAKRRQERRASEVSGQQQNRIRLYSSCSSYSAKFRFVSTRVSGPQVARVDRSIQIVFHKDAQVVYRVGCSVVGLASRMRHSLTSRSITTRPVDSRR